LGHIKTYACLALLSAISAGYLFLRTGFGFGTTPDSVVYIGAARSLLLGQGFGFPSGLESPSPITNFPPLFPTALAAIGFFGIDPLDAARLFNVALFAVNIYLAGLLVYEATDSTAAIAVSAVMWISPALLITHSMIWSEPLFLLLVLIAAFGTTRYINNSSSTALLLVGATAFLGPLVRYAGISLTFAAIFTVARKNLKHAAVVAFAGGVGLVGWLIRNHFVAGDLANRRLVFHLPAIADLVFASNTALEWVGGLILTVLFAALVIFTVLNHPPAMVSKRYGIFLVSFAVVYLVVLAISLLFGDAQVPLDHRILSPLYLVAALYAAIFIVVRAQAKFLQLAWVAFVVVLFVAHSWTAMVWLDRVSTQGVGFSSAQWRQSATMDYLRRTKGMSQVYTNAPDSVYLLAGLPASMLPRHTDPGTRLVNPEYSKQISRIGQHGGFVAYFIRVTWRSYLPTEERLTGELHLQLLADLGDGAVYRIPPR